MITRAFVDRAIGPGGDPMTRTRRALAVVLTVSKAEIERREAAWRLYGKPAREARKRNEAK